MGKVPFTDVYFSTQESKWVPTVLGEVHLQWGLASSSGSANTLSHFMPKKPEISTSPVDYLCTLPFYKLRTGTVFLDILC